MADWPETMKRTRAQWSNMVPAAVAAGSAGQIYYCIADARADILTLAARVDQLEWEAKQVKLASQA